MASFIKIGSIWIDFSQYDLTNQHQCEPSTICDNENEDNAQDVRRTEKIGLMVEGQKENVMSTVICEPKESEMEGIDNVSINNNDDEASVVDKGNGNMIQTNEELEFSSSGEEEVLAFASHFLPFPYDALQFGEGASKFFTSGTDSRLELNIDEGIEENLLDEFYFPPNNVKENNVLTKGKECENDIDEMAMQEVPKILKDKLPNVETSNGMKGHSILFEEGDAISEEEVKFEKRSSGKSSPQEKMDPKRRKYEKN